MELERTVGLHSDRSVWLPDRRAAAGCILLKLPAMGVEVLADTGSWATACHPRGCATDALWPVILYMPEDMEIDMNRWDIT